MVAVSGYAALPVVADSEALNSLVATFLGAVLAPWVLGMGCVRVIGLAPAAGRRCFFGWSYLVGQFVQAGITAAWLWLGQPIDGRWLPAIACVLGLLLLHRSTPKGQVLPRKTDPWSAAVLLALICYQLDCAMFEWLRPLVLYDGADIWAAKAKVLWCAHGMPLDFTSTYARHPAYPQLNPLVQVLAFAANGRVLLWENRLPIQFFGIALLMLLSAALERTTGRWIAAALLVAFASTSFAESSATAYSDVLLALGWFAMFDAALRWWATRERAWWRLTCCALGVVLAAKNEGSLLVVAALVATVAAALLPSVRVGMPSPGRALGWLAIPVAVVCAGQYFNSYFGLSTDLTDPSLCEGRDYLGQIAHFFAARWWIVLRHYGELLMGSSEGRLVLIMLFAPLVVAPSELLRLRLVPWLATVIAIGGYMLVFIGTNAGGGGPEQGLAWHLDTAATRTLLHVLPTAVLVIALHLQRTPST